MSADVFAYRASRPVFRANRTGASARSPFICLSKRCSGPAAGSDAETARLQSQGEGSATRPRATRARELG